MRINRNAPHCLTNANEMEPVVRGGRVSALAEWVEHLANYHTVLTQAQAQKASEIMANEHLFKVDRDAWLSAELNRILRVG